MAKSNVIPLPILSDRDLYTVRNPLSNNIQQIAILAGYVNGINGNSKIEAYEDFSALIGDKSKFVEDSVIKGYIERGYQLYRERPCLKVDEIFNEYVK